MFRWWNLILGAALWGPSMVSAATILDLSEEEMIRASNLIVEGRILRQKTLAIGPSKRLVTESLLEVLRFFKGETASRWISVRTLGGQDTTRLQIVSGEAPLRPGQRLILFLAPTPPNPWETLPTSFVPVGMAWGVFFLRRDPRTSVLVVERPLDLPHRVRPLSPGRLQDVPLLFSPAPLALSTFLPRLQRLIQKSRPAASLAPERQAPAPPSSAPERLTPAPPSSAPERLTPAPPPSAPERPTPAPPSSTPQGRGFQRGGR